MRSHTDIYNVVYTIYHSITYEVPQVQYTIRTRFTPIPTPLTLRQLFELLYTSGQFLGTVGFAVRFSTFAWAFAQNESELSPKSIQSCFQLLQGPSCSKQPSAVSPFSIQPGQNTITVVRRIEQVLTVIYCNWAPAEAGNSSDYILEKPPTHFEARKTNFQHFRGKRSCERTQSYFFNGLQIQLHKNWLYVVYRVQKKQILLLGAGQRQAFGSRENEIMYVGLSHS